MVRIPSLTTLIKVVCKALDSSSIERTSKTAWTRHIALAIARARPSGCVVYGKQFAPKRPEFLCDQVWGIESKAWESYEGLALVMECEWNGDRESFLEDFCKVLDVAAERRLFIGNLRTRALWPHREGLLDTLSNMAQRHRFFSNKDRVAVFFCEQGGEEDVECWVIRGDGSFRPV